MDFNPDEEDVLNMSDILTNFGENDDFLSDFVQVTQHSEPSFEAVEADDNVTQVATLQGTSDLPDIDTLLANGSLEV